MQTHAFGNTGLMVSVFGLGCARIGGIFQGDPRGFLDLLAGARDAGINFFDTADMYSQGESEALLGRAFRGVRDRVIIASKAGYCLPGRRRLAARLKPFLRPALRLIRLKREHIPAGARGSLSQDFSPAYLRKAVEASLRRLRTDYLDLFQLHSPSATVIARGEWEPALQALKQAGKIRHYGVSCDTVEAGVAALRYSGIASLQFPLSVLEPGIGEALLPQLRARGVAGIARECLANGLLVKAADEIDLSSYCRTPEERTKREAQLASYRLQANRQGTSLVDTALDFVTRTEGVSVSLLGARNIDQLRGLLARGRAPVQETRSWERV